MATQLLNLGHDGNGRSTHLLELDSWLDWPTDLSLPSQHFCLLLAADARAVHAETISALASSSISDGCAYLAAWGPECEFVHDIFDETYLGGGLSPGRPVLMTTCHADAPLEEAIEFLRRDTLPEEAFQSSCNAVVAAVIANPEWSTIVRTALSP
jgi:hypothetical protein